MNFVYWLVAMVLLAACVWLWILYRREKGKRWDETSRCAGLENEIQLWIQATTALDRANREIVKHANEILGEKRKLQERLSAELCPMNNHVWLDGKCVKCGVKK